MTRTQALKLATRKFGRRAVVVDRKRYSSASARAEARSLRTPKPVQPDISKWPDSATLGEFRAAQAEWRKKDIPWKKRDQELFAQAVYYRYRVGEKSTTAFGEVLHIRGEGDTWEEALVAAGVQIPLAALLEVGVRVEG